MERTFTKPHSDIVMQQPSSGFTHSSKLLMKRAFDLTFAIGVLLLVCTWLFPLIALAIKATSPGPVFFKQRRHGKDNVPFNCLKFRTMIASKDADIRQAIKNDERITKVGRILRATSLDELPQLINVVRGEMSIVGPRPHAVPMNEVFAQEIHNYMFRHAVKPGITGLAQAKGYRGETKNFHDIYARYKLDMFYVKNWCLYFDSKIILETIYALFCKNERAY